jgi:hypothetical protein
MGLRKQETPSRPRERGDPYAVCSQLSSAAVALLYNRRQGLWVPACAGTTRGGVVPAPYPPPSIWRPMIAIAFSYTVAAFQASIAAKFGSPG